MNFNLSRIQFFLLLFIVQTGSSFFSFPSSFINVVGRDAWLVFLVAGVLHYMLILFYERFYLQFTFGPFVGWLYKGYWLFVTVCYLAYIDYTLAVWGFPETPQILVLAALVSVSLYANLSRPETVINLSVILIPLILIFLVTLQFAWEDLIWTNIFPIGEASGTEWFQGLVKAQISFMGIELFLFFRRYVDVKEKIKGYPLFIYQMVWFSFFFFSILITILYFTLSGLQEIPEPLLFILKSREVTFLERLDLFFLYIWVIWNIITITIFSFSAMYVHRLHAKKQYKRDVVIWHILLVLIPLFFVSKNYVEKLIDYIIYLHLLFTILIPIFVIFSNRRKEK